MSHYHVRTRGVTLTQRYENYMRQHPQTPHIAFELRVLV